LVALVAVCCILQFAALATGRQERAVDVLVGVASSFGVPVTDLSAGAFIMEVDGQPQTISAVRRAAEPLAVTLLVDLSGSMFRLRWIVTDRGEVQLPTFPISSLRDVVLGGFRRALIPNDQARLAMVRSDPWIGEPIPVTREGLERGLRELEAEFRNPARRIARASPVWDAAAASVDRLADAPGRRVVVVITDGKVNANRLSPEDLAERAVKAGVAIAMVDEGQALLLRQDGSPTAAIRSDQALRWVAEATGGAYLPDTALLGLPARPNPSLLVERAIAGHREAYRLTITVPADGRPHTLKVIVKKEGVVVRAPAFIPAR
jgi:hypothetical protein